ncbi:MAG: hypothetical protein PHG81_11660 [Aliarcobacter sp.]|jgi:hypothetical protein|nr:hypothetical protein [Aliarcobacter sp.]
MLKVTLLGLGLFVGSLFAQDNLNKISSTSLGGYSVSLSSQNKIELNTTNPVLVSVYKKGKILSVSDLDLTLYTPDNKTIEYKHIKSVDNSNLENIKFSQKGDYRYVVKFSNQIGGVSHYLRGDFKI